MNFEKGEYTSTTDKHRSTRFTKARMSRAASAQARMVAYLPSLRTIIQRLRATASIPSSLTTTLLTTSTPSPLTTPTPTTNTLTTEALYNTDMIAAGIHPGFPLPGAVGLPPPTATPTTSDSAATPSEEAEHESADKSEAPFLLTCISEKPQGTVEFLVQECPHFLHGGLMNLFPGVSVSSGALTVITLSERTRNDMTGWSPEVEEERELLLGHFVDSAKEICSRLSAAGHWADFVDPSSGRAFYSAYSHATLFETDDRFHYLGFEVVDLGCCKSISHPFWGSHTFVGTIFTNAPTNSPTVQGIMHL